MNGPVAWLTTFADRTPNAPLIGTTDGWLTYVQVQERMRRVRGLLSKLGVRPGDRVVLALPNVAGTLACWFAVQSLGATSVELDREWADAALAGVVAQSKATLALISGRDARKWAAMPGLSRLVVVHPTPPPEALQAVLGERYAGWVSDEGLTGDVGEGPPLSEPEVAQVVFTSGTTSTPRGVLQTTKNLTVSTDGIVEYLHLTGADRSMLVLPLFYVYGKSVMLSHLRVGASVFMDHRFMYPRVVMEAIGTERCTNMAGVPLTFESLRRQVDLKSMDLGTLRFVTQAGGPMQPDTIAWVRENFAPTPLYVMYGQTEATSRLSYLPPELAETKKGSVGRGMPGVELAVFDDDGKPVPPGEEGHLVARGEVVMPGYLDAPEETAKVLKNGWLWTGDLARWDADGFVFLTGRAKHVLKLGGHRVAPAELERAVLSEPRVREAVVVGAPDALEGEVAVAFIISDDPTLDAPTLLKHCRTQLPGPRVPRRIVFVPDFPRNSSGKILLGELKKQAAELHASLSREPV